MEPHSVELLTPQQRANNQENGNSVPATAYELPITWHNKYPKIKKYCLYFAYLSTFLFILLIVVVLGRALFIHEGAEESEILNKLLALEADFVSEDERRPNRLAAALTFETIATFRPSPEEKQEFLNFHSFIQKSFPKLHASRYVELEVVNERSLLYTVSGSVEGILPYMLSAHLDVVSANTNSWTFPPFSGKIIDNVNNDSYVYGRGALDNKAGVMGILEALEFIIGTKQEQPKRSFYIALGHDEEIHGYGGAVKIAERLKNKGVKKLDFILDEGFPVSKGYMSGLDENLAVIGVSEKGYLDIKVHTERPTGHASMPPWESSIVMVADAISKLEKNKLPIRFCEGPERYTFEYLVPYVNFEHRVVYSNLWLFCNIFLARELQYDQTFNSIVRTTTAVTEFKAGTQANVVPEEACATVSHRIHPSDNVNDILYGDKMLVGDKVTVSDVAFREPHPVSPFDAHAAAYQSIVASFHQALPGTVVVPGLLVANTDSDAYLDFTGNIYRVSPFIINKAEFSSYHGNDEKISFESYKKAVNFYYRLMRNSDELVDIAP